MNRFVVLLALSLTLGGPVFAQSDEPTSPFEGLPPIPLVDDIEQKLTLARKMMSVSRFQEAGDLLEILYEKRPDDPLIQNLLRNCYDQLGRYDRSEELLRRALEKSPESFGYQMSLAEVLARQGKRDEAAEVYSRASRNMPPADLSRHQLIVRSMLDSGLDSLALGYIDQTRPILGDSLAFRMERGGILERRRQYEAAAWEYLPLLQNDTTPQAGEAERKLLGLLDYPESSARVEKILVARADSSAGLRAMRLLADYYLKTNRFVDAFDYTLRLDSLEERSGWSVMVYIRRCAERRAWIQADSAAAYMLANYPNSQYETEAAFERARALAELGRPYEAIGVYRELASRSPVPQIRNDAMYGVGTVFYNNLAAYDSALYYYDNVVKTAPRGRSYVAARLAIPRCLLKAGHLARAAEALDELTGQRLPDEGREEVEYLQGLLSFFGHRYDSAGIKLHKLMVDFPRGFYVNDALELLVILGRAGEAEELLGQYADASYLFFRGKSEEARIGLQQVADASDRSLADLALHDLTELAISRADTTAALQAIDRLDQEYPESYYRPLGLKIKADILASTDLPKARQLYRYLLENCQEYPFAAEVREKLRAIETGPPVG